MKSKCACQKNCLRSVNVKTIKLLRYRYWSKSQLHRNQWLIQAVSNSDFRGRFRYLTMDNGQQVCCSAFLKIYHINKNKLTKCTGLHEQGAISSRGKRPRPLTTATINAVAWLEDYASFYGDRMPHSADILLPYKTQKQVLYWTYKREHPGDTVTSMTTFYRIWKTYLPTLKIKKVFITVFILKYKTLIITSSSPLTNR